MAEVKEPATSGDTLMKKNDCKKDIEQDVAAQFKMTTHQNRLKKKDYHKWIVAVMTFIIFIVTGGVYYTGGIIAPELLASFPQNGESSVSLIISMVPSLMNFSGK